MLPAEALLIFNLFSCSGQETAGEKKADRGGDGDQGRMGWTLGTRVGVVRGEGWI